eukprot:14736073-Alexandrium_andersonii.AAC.1
MSASLVGSEMCIRDSRTPAVPGAGSFGPGPTRAAAFVSAKAWGHGGDAVSYTHLTLPTICSV